MKRAVWAAGVALAALCAIPLVDWLTSGGGLRALPSRPYADRALVLAAFVPYGAALLVLRRKPVDPRIVVGVGVACLLLLIAVPPRSSQDVYSYLFYGRMWEHGGLNPLAVPPSAFAHDPWFAFVRWPDTPSAYGPVWVGLNGAFSAAAGSQQWIALALAKVVTVGGAVAGAVFAHRVGSDAERPGRDAFRLALVMWNPLLIFSVAGDGHVDGVLLGLVIGALLARKRERMGWATAALAAATLIKPYAGMFLLLHLAALARAPDRLRLAVRHAGAALAGAVAAYAPFWAGIDTFSGLRDVATRFSATPARDVRNLLARMLEAFGAGASSARSGSAGAVRILSVAVLLAVMGWLLRGRLRQRTTQAWAAAFATYLVVTPWFLPWHMLPLLGLAAAQTAEEEDSALSTAAPVLSATAILAVPVVRFGLPAAAAWAAGRRRSLPRRFARITPR